MGDRTVTGEDNDSGVLKLLSEYCGELLKTVAVTGMEVSNGCGVEVMGIAAGIGGCGVIDLSCEVSDTEDSIETGTLFSWVEA